MVTHQLQVERRTGKVRRPETDVLPLSHATNLAGLGLVNLVCGVYARIRVSSGEVGLVVDIG